MEKNKRKILMYGAPLFILALFGVALLFQPTPVYAVAKTWDGGGVTNNWSEDANWSGDTKPLAGDTVTFDATSVKDCTIDTSISVTSITIASTYSGIITQSGTSTVSTSGNFSIAGGTFTGGSGDVDVNGTFTISGGTFTSTSGNLSVASSWTHTAGGTFNHNNGTVTIDGNAATWNVTTTETFYNLEVNKNNAQTLTVSSGDTLKASNDLTLTNGELSTGTLELTGATGSIGAGWDGGTTGSVVLIDGAGVQTFTINGGALEPANTFTVNNASATVGVAGTGTITFFATTLQAGAIDTSGYTVVNASTLTISGGTYTNGSGSKTFSTTFSQSAGTFNGNTASLVLSSSFTLSGGTFNATSGTMSVTGSWTHTAGGTFNHNNGTVKFVGGVDTTIDVNTTETFYNVTEEKTTNWILTLATGDTAVINNALTLTDGRLMSASSTAIWELKGTISVGSNWDSGSANLKFSGTGDQSLTLVNTSSWDPNGGLTIDKASGSFTLGSALVLDGVGSVLLTKGTFDLNGFSLRCTDFTISAGTFTSGSVAVDIDDDLIINGGTWNASSTSTVVGGDLTIGVGATFNHNNGLFTFDTTVDQTINVDTSATFYDLTINKNGYLQTITSGDTIVVTNILNLTDGRFGVGTIDMQGPTTTVASTYDSGTATLKFSGTGVQTLTMQHASVNNFDGNITVDKSGGSFTLGSALTMDGSQTLTLTNGTFNTGNYDLTTVAYTQTNGTFNGGSSSQVDVNGVFTLSGGTYNATTQMTIISNGFTHTAGGTFNHNNGTVKFDNSSDRTYDFATSESFYNVILEKTNGYLATIATGDTLIVENTFTCNDGRFGTGTLSFKGDVSFGSLCDSTSSPITIGGTGDQTLTLVPTGAILSGGVTVNKASGNVYLGSNWQNNNGTFTLTNGTMYLRDSAATNNYSFIVSSFSQAGGTFHAGSSTMTVNGTFTLTNGTFNASTGTTTFDGNFTHTSGTGSFNHNNGTVVVTGQGTTWDVGTSETFGSFNLSKTSGYALSVSSGDTLIVTGLLTLTDGKWSLGSIEAQGDVSVASTYDADGSGLFKFTGTANQTFTLNTVVRVGTGDVTVNKNSGQVNLVGNFSPNSSSQDFVIVEGTFDINGYTLTTIGSSGTFVVQDGGTLRLQGTETISNAPNLQSGSTVYYDGSSSVTLKDYTYSNLTIGGDASAVFTLAANEVIGNNLTIASGVLSQGGLTLTVTNIFSNEGTLRRYQVESFTGTMDVNSGTVEYVGDADASVETVTITDFGGAGTDYFNLRINDPNGTKDVFVLGSATTVAGTVQVTSSELQQGANSLTPASVVVDGGVFTGGSSAITVSGGVVISSGSLVSTTNTLQVSGGWTHTAGGTFSHNGGTVVFAGNSSAVDVSTNETFNALTVDKTGGQTLTIASGDNLIAIGTLTLNNGLVDTGVLQPRGDVIVNSGFDGGNAGLTFSGSNAQSFNLTGATGNFDGDITVNKSAETVTLASALVMDASGQDLTITLGTFNTSGSNHPLTVVGTVSVNGGALTLNASSVNLDGALSIDGGTLNATSGNINLAGNLNKISGTFNHNNGTIILDGTNQQISGAFTLYNLTKSVSSADTLTLPASTTTTVVGTLVLNGASGQLLSLRSSTSGTQASIDPQGSRTTQYLDVKDNNNIQTTPMSCRTGCVDSLNNTNWSIGTPAVTVTQSSGSTNATEGGSTDTYTVVLNILPTATVTIAVSVDSQITLSPNNLTFNSSNWNAPQTVTVTAVNDNVVEGTHTGAISHSATSSDSGYNGISISSVTTNITDNDVASVTVSSFSGSVTEAGGSGTFTLVLTSQPSADVSIGVSSSDTTEGTVSPSSVTFTSSNWNETRTVTVTGQDDSLDDGDVSFDIITAPATSADANYSGVNPNNVSVTNLDNDTSGVTSSSISGNTSEAGATATFTVVLSAQPTADVTFGLSSSDTTEGTVNPSSVTFTTSNWNTTQTITVTGVDDSISDGNVAYSIVLGVVSSADANYNNLNPADVTVTNVDGDTAGVTQSQSNGSTSVSEGGTTDTYSLVLTSQPTSNVTITLSANSQIRLSVSSVTFTSANWNSAQSITVSAVRDSTVEGNHTGVVSHSVASSDSAYNGLSISSLTVTITDNNRPTAAAGSDTTITESTGTTQLSGTSSSDGDGDALTYAWTESSDSGDGCSLSSATSSTPTVTVLNKESSYDCVFALTVNDAYNDSAATDTVTVHVTATNDSPAIGDLSASVSVVEGSNLVIVVAASDIDTPSLSLSAQDTNGDFSAKSVQVASLFTTSGNSGTFSWTPGNTLSGNYTVGFQASDGANTVTESVAITVTNTNQAPELTEDIPNVAFVSGTTTQVVFDLDEHFTDPDGDALTYEVTGNKDIEVTISDTGKVRFTASADFVGVEDLSFTASDPDGLTTESNEIDVTVTEAETETDVDHLTGTPKGKGVIKIYNKQNQLLAKVKAFPTGGVVPKLGQIKDKTYIFAIKRRAGTTMHVYTSSGELVMKKRLSPHLHFRHLAVGNLNTTKATEEIVVATKRDHKLYFKVFRFNPENKEFTLLQDNMVPFINRSYRVVVRKKNVVVVLNGKGEVIYSWIPFASGLNQ